MSSLAFANIPGVYNSPLFPRLLFFTTTPHRAVAYITLQQLFALVMHGVGVKASPGSSRASVASMGLAEEVPENAVMEAADWASACVLYSNYICLFSSDVLREVVQPAASLQNTLLTLTVIFCYITGCLLLQPLMSQVLLF